ncbi:glycosyltransferase family 9 protein [Chryseobacterium sp. SIMBA_028]|uniref:glycosyltransferase family 9 protein n=2 Tax=unclassified Chryseobacterium TaxID=2593645 RepID=UPI00397DCAC5
MNEFNFKKTIEIEFTNIGEERRFDPHALAEQIQKCDLFLYLNTWIYENDIQALLNQLPHLKKSAGYYSCFTDQIAYSTRIHNFDLYFRMVHLFDKNLLIKDFSYPPLLDENYKRIAPQVRKNKMTGIKYLAVHFDSEPEKSLKSNIYKEFLEKILDTYANICLVPIGLDNIDLQEKYQHRILSFGQPLPFLIATAYLETADFFIGVDSCFLHISDLYAIPSIGIFGPTSEVEFGFRFNKKHLHLRSATKDLKDISTDNVYKRFNELIDV